MNESPLAAHENEDYQTDRICISLVKNANHLILSNLSRWFGVQVSDVLLGV